MVLYTFVVSLAIAMLNVRLLVLSGNIGSKNIDSKVLVLSLTIVFNILLFSLVKTTLTFWLSKYFIVLGDIVVLTLSTIIFTIVSVGATLFLHNQMTSKVFKALNKRRTKTGETKIVKHSVEDEFYLRAEGSAVFLYDLFDKEIAYGTIVKAPLEESEGTKYIIQPFCEVAETASFSDINEYIHSLGVDGFIYVDFDNGFKAVVIENESNTQKEGESAQTRYTR